MNEAKGQFTVIGYQLKDRMLPDVEYDEEGDVIPDDRNPQDIHDEMYEVIFEKTYDSLEKATEVAEEVAERISDVYGMSYVDIIDEDGDIYDEISGPYDADASLDLTNLQNENLNERYAFPEIDNAIYYFRSNLGREPEVDDIINELEKTGYFENNYTDFYELPMEKQNNVYKNLAFEISARLNDSVDESLNELAPIDEAISPENKAKSDLIRGAYNAIDGKKIGKHTLTPEQQQALDDANLDAWGFRGETKIVTPGGNDVIHGRESDNFYVRRNGHPNRNQNLDKMDLIHRAAMLDDRDENQDIRHYSQGGNNYQQGNRQYDADIISANTNKMKQALNTRSYYQRALANEDDVLMRDINSINQNADKDIAKINDDSQLNYYRGVQKGYQDKIDSILAKHKRECLESINNILGQLNEATISDEDKRDSELLRSIAQKIQVRANAKLTPEEKEVFSKYNIGKDNWYRELTTPQGNFLNTSNDKVNVADQARKKDARYLKNKETFGIGSTENNKYDLLDLSRDKEAQDMSQDYDDARRALISRNMYRDIANELEASRPEKIANINAKRDADIAKANERSTFRRNNAQEKTTWAQSTIDDLLKKEELEEDLDDDLSRTIETGLSGNVNIDILNSVIGQMSDGIWENSPGYAKYWLFISVDNQGNLKVDNNHYDSYYKVFNAWRYMSDQEIKKFFSNKIKYIAQLYMHDNNINPYKGWRADNDEVCDYLDRGSNPPVTIGDAFKAAQILK